MANNFEESRKKFVIEKLNQLYSRVPRVKCQGHCASFCSAIGYESIEKMNIEEKHGQMPIGFENPIDNGKTIRCGSLTSDNRCNIYDTRPMICRMFGASQMMLQCPIGCELENQSQSRLTPKELMGLLLEVKLLNLKYLNPIKYQKLIVRFETPNQNINLEDEMPEALYNVSRDLWEKDLSSEELKTRYALESHSGESVDMNQYFESKKMRVVKSIEQTLKSDIHKGEICVINTDTMMKKDYQREEFYLNDIPMNSIQIYDYIFNQESFDDNLSSQSQKCETCGSSGFEKYMKPSPDDKNTCQFCEGEF